MKETEFARMVKAAFDVIGESQLDESIGNYEAHNIYRRAFAAARDQQLKTKPRHKTARAVASAFFYADTGYTWENAIDEIGQPNEFCLAVRHLTAFAYAIARCVEEPESNP